MTTCGHDLVVASSRPETECKGIGPDGPRRKPQAAGSTTVDTHTACLHKDMQVDIDASQLNACPGVHSRLSTASAGSIERVTHTAPRSNEALDLGLWVLSHVGYLDVNLHIDAANVL